MDKTFADFFAGIGLVELALCRNNWKHMLSVDYSDLKEKVHLENFPTDHHGKYIKKDILTLEPSEVPEFFLAHASFPCTDVSAAGSREGSQNGKESSAIDSFLKIIFKMRETRPPLVMLENVKGLISSSEGLDLRFLIQHLNSMDYIVDLLCINAKHFVPQSRERVFIIGHNRNYSDIKPLKEGEISELHKSDVRDESIINFYKKNIDLKWTVKKLPDLPEVQTGLYRIVDSKNNEWWNQERVDYLLNQMFDRHVDWIYSRQNRNQYRYVTAFRRMRIRDGEKQSTAEIRTDGLAGCLRTSKGGSAKQILIKVGKGEVKARLLSPYECSRLMGARRFKIPKDVSITDSLFCFGDAVCVDVIEWLDQNYLTPTFMQIQSKKSSNVSGEIIMESIELNLTKEIENQLDKDFNEWCDKNIDKKFNLPYRGRLYGALVVLYNIEKSVWKFDELDQAVSTDVKKFFGARSIKNHTSHRVSLAITEHGYEHLSPASSPQGELGRTSTATKIAGLQMIKLISNSLKGISQDDFQQTGDSIIKYLYNKIFPILEQYKDLGGIEIPFSASESIASFISKIIAYPSGNSGAILQHLVGAKLELRFKNGTLKIKHNSSATADKQTRRHGDFDIGSTVIHVTKSPTTEHYRKAKSNAESGRKVYLLVPDKIVRATKELAESDFGSSILRKIDIFSIEQYLTQNLDEMAVYDKNSALKKLKNLLIKYNELIETYENDNSLIIVIPDFGV